MHKQTQTKFLSLLPENRLTKTFFSNEAVTIKATCLKSPSSLPLAFFSKNKRSYTCSFHPSIFSNLVGRDNMQVSFIMFPSTSKRSKYQHSRWARLSLRRAEAASAFPAPPRPAGLALSPARAAWPRLGSRYSPAAGEPARDPTRGNRLRRRPPERP